MKFKWGRRPPTGNSGPESQDNAPPPNPVPNISTPTWGEHIESVNMSQPQNMVNAPAAGGTVMNITFNSSGGGENTRISNAQHDDIIRHPRPESSSHQDSEGFRNLTRTPRADHEIYANQLLTKKRGYPLWVPGPGMQLPIEYRRQGVSIGDVGVITSTGEFDFLFNILHPADHAINDGMVPQGFFPLPCRELERDIQRTTVYGPGTYLASSSVRKTSMNWISETSIDQRFESTAEEAAILVMPDGATTRNLLNTWAVRYTISKKAEDWYTYARFTRGRDIKSGDIRVVVGIDKVSSWGIATSACNTGPTASYVFKHDPTHTYRWDCIGGSGRVGPQKNEIHDLMEDDAAPQNQCVFIRTINFSLSGRMWNDFPSDAVQQPNPGSGGFNEGDSSSSKPGESKEGNGSGSGSGGTSSGNQPSSMPGSLQYNQLVKFDPVELVASHPTTALHTRLHEKFPDASMVISEDMDWMSVLNDDDVVFPEPEDLCERILEAHELYNHQGIIQVVRKDDSAFRELVERRWRYLDETLNATIALRNTAYDDQGKSPCDGDTRIEILAEITNWVNDVSPKSQNFFWLSGAPGCGKSAIAASLAQYCMNEGTLWAQFFINQSTEETTDPKVYFPSIARQMAQHSPNSSVSETIYDILQANPSLLNRMSYYQALNLFVRVVQVACDVEKSLPVVVIIDELDQTSQTSLEDTALIFSLLFKEVLRPNAKVFISTRTDHEITETFFSSLQSNYQRVKHVHLDTSQPSSMEDVSRYLSRRIGKLATDRNLNLEIRPGGFESLCHRAAGLFIWAAAVVKLLEEQLNSFGHEYLNILDAIDVRYMADVYQLYQTILNLAYSSNAWTHETFRSVVGFIIALKEPLTIGDIGALLDLRCTTTSDPVDILQFVKNLRTVLVAGTSVITNRTVSQLHNSFVEFITGDGADEEFRIDLEIVEAEIVLKCLQLVWSLGNGDDRSRMSAPSVRYAMHNWTRHLPNEGIASGIVIFGDNEAFLRFYSSATPLRKSFMSASGDYRTHMYDPREGFPPPAPFHFSHSSTIQVGDWVESLAISMDGRLIAAGMPSGDVLLWDSRSHTRIGGPNQGHSRKAKSVCFSPDSRWLVSGSWDRTIRVWDCQTGQAVGSPLVGHTSVIFSICTDGRFIISGGGDKTIRIWDLNSGKQIGSSIDTGGQVYAVALSNDGRIAAGVDNTVSVWDVKTRHHLASMEGHTSSAWTVAFSPDNSRIVSGSWDKTSRLWNAQTYREIHVYSHGDRVYSVAFTPNGQHFASGNEDRAIHVCHCNTDPRIDPPLEDHTEGVLSVAFSPDGRQLFSGSRDGTIRIWSQATHKEWPKLSEQITTIHLTRSAAAPSSHIVSFEGNPSVVSTCYSPDRTLYAASTRDGHVSLWNIAHDLVWESDTPIHPVHLLRLTADRLIISSPDGSMWTWDMVDGKPTEQTPTTSGPQLKATNIHRLKQRSSSSQSASDNYTAQWIPFKVDAGLWAYVDGTFIRFERVGGGSVTFIDVGDIAQ